MIKIPELNMEPITPPRCINCGTPEVFTGYGETNTPKGHDMIYAMYRCPATECRGLTGVANLFGRFQHGTPDTIVFLELRGDKPVEIPWFDLRLGLIWDGQAWIRP